MKMPPVLCCIVFLFVSMLSAVARQQEKPRVIVTTDGEIDDQSSRSEERRVGKECTG